MGRAPTLYRVIVWLVWPRRVRRVYGPELEAMFARCVQVARAERGSAGVLFAWTRGIVDVVASGMVAHVQEWKDRRLLLQRQPPMQRNLVSSFALELGRDLRIATRALIRDRVFTVAALVTIAVCITANASVFSVVRSIVLKPLPLPHAERIVLMSNIYPKAAPPTTGPSATGAGAPDYFDRLSALTVVDAQAMYRRANMAVDLAGGAERANVIRATPSFYRMLEVTPARGRLFSDDDGEIGNDSKVLLSYGFWQRAFGGADSIVGQSIRLNGAAFTVVGVMPRGFQYVWNDVDAWMPLSFAPAVRSDNARHSNNYNMIARLRPGATVDQAQREIDALNARNGERFPNFKTILENAGFRTVVAPLQNEVIQDVRPTLYLLWAGAVLVLLVGAVNVANLIMVRAAGRAREMAIRRALGARTGRLGRQILTETTVLTIIGGALGVLGALWVLRSATVLRLDLLPRAHEIRLDWLSIAAMIGLAVIVGVFAGLTPLVQVWRVNLSETMREGGRGGSAGAAPNRLRNALATAQVALAFVLLVGAGLLLSTFRAVIAINPGFNPTHVATGSVTLPVARYNDGPALASGANKLLTAIRSVPGVTVVGASSTIPLGDSFNNSVVLAEGYEPRPGESLVSPFQVIATAGYFEAMQIPLVRGRYFDARDVQTSNSVAIVDERLAKRFWGRQDPLGKRMYLPQGSQDILRITDSTQFITVVGVVKDVQLTGLAPRDEIAGVYYFAHAQLPSRTLMFAARSSGDLDLLANAMRKAVASVDPQLPLFDMQSMSARLDRSLVPRRLPMILAMIFGGVALFLAAIGIYGVLAYRVTQRQKELSIRLALGSTTGGLFGIVLRDGARITVVGLIVGALGVLGATSLLTRLLYGVRPMDPTVIGVVALVLASVAFVATLVPARRAARTDPVGALNEQ